MTFNKPTKTNTPDSYPKAFDYAMFLLSLAEKTEQQIVKKLQDKGFAPEVVEKVVSELKESNFINDQRFVEALTRSHLEYKYAGYFLIKSKLLQKGLTSKFLDTTLPGLVSVAEELKAAKKYLEKQGLNLESADYKAKQKVFAKLKSRGFRSEVIGMLFSGQIPDDVDD